MGKQTASQKKLWVQLQSLGGTQKPRIDQYIAMQLPDLSRKKVKNLLNLGLIFVNGKRIYLAKYELNDGDQITICANHVMMAPPTAINDAHVLFNDTSIIIFNKPPLIAVVGAYHQAKEQATFTKISHDYCLKNGLLNPTGYLEPVHRLDKETSGIILYVKEKKLKGFMQTLQIAGKLDKTYVAVIQGQLPERSMTVNKAIANSSKKTSPLSNSLAQERTAITQFRFLGKLPANRSCIEAKPRTGRKHQIRIHLASIGYPIVGDKKYGIVPPNQNDRDAFRHQLHAIRLQFTHPISQKKISVSAPLFPDMQYCNPLF